MIGLKRDADTALGAHGHDEDSSKLQIARQSGDIHSSSSDFDFRKIIGRNA